MVFDKYMYTIFIEINVLADVGKKPAYSVGCGQLIRLKHFGDENLKKKIITCFFFFSRYTVVFM